MKIAIIQEASRHSANAHLRECFCLQRAFARHPDVTETAVWGKGHPNFNTPPDWNEFDIIINIENYSHDWMPDVSKTTKPLKFVWSIDSHVLDVHPHKRVFDEGNYHYFLQATSIFCDRVPNSIWFPNAYDNTQLTPSITRIHDRKKFIGFCGSTLNRAGICNAMVERIRGFSPDYWKIGRDMIDCVQSYKIHFNLNYNWDVNYRTFETCGLGTVLLTNNNMNTKDHDVLGFKHGINCLFWNSKDPESLFRVVNEYINKDDELEKIAIAGTDLVSKHHTYYNRIKEIIDIYNRKGVEQIYESRNFNI